MQAVLKNGDRVEASMEISDPRPELIQPPSLRRKNA
jgi:hypothetical protein